MREGREIRLFATREEMMVDYMKYPLYYPIDHVKLRGKFITIENEITGYKVYWFCEEDHDIPQCIMGLQISSLMLSYKLQRETIQYAMTRLRWTE